MNNKTKKYKKSLRTAMASFRGWKREKKFLTLTPNKSIHSQSSLENLQSMRQKSLMKKRRGLSLP